MRNPPLKTLGCTMVLPDRILRTWKPREQQIFPAEAVVLPIATWAAADILKDRDVICFIDNEAAAAAAIRGDSSQPDVQVIIQAAHLLWMRLGVRMWLEWIDSDSNPADGLSRLGVADPWSSLQGWELREEKAPPWESVPGRPDVLAAELSRHWADGGLVTLG